MSDHLAECSLAILVLLCSLGHLVLSRQAEYSLVHLALEHNQVRPDPGRMVQYNLVHLAREHNPGHLVMEAVEDQGWQLVGLL